MSHILFGTYKSKCNPIIKVKKYMSNTGIRLYLDEEINFYDDIHKMILEQSGSKHNHIFCLTTDNQPTNSDDLLFPYNKYNNNILFPNGDDRSFFNNYCQKNIEKFKESLEYFIDIISPEDLEIFLTEGYDDHFKNMYCNIDEMTNHILQQVENSFFLNSTIYHI